MQVLESTDKIAPKSVLRHRPIGDSKPPKKRPIASRTPLSQSTNVTPAVQRASRTPIPAPVEERQKDIPQWQHVEPDDEVATQPTRSAYKSTSSASASPKITARYPSVTAGTALNKPHAQSTLRKSKIASSQIPQVHPLLYLGIGMLAMVVLWTLLSSVIHWANITLDDLRYGRPRTAQYDVAVGHNDSVTNPSHFIVINLHRRIEVIELAGGDASHAHIYMGPQLYGPDDDLTPATLSFADVNGDHKLDMIINVQGSHVVFLNDQGTFRAPLPAERPRIDAFLQHWKP